MNLFHKIILLIVGGVVIFFLAFNLQSEREVNNTPTNYSTPRATRQANNADTTTHANSNQNSNNYSDQERANQIQKKNLAHDPNAQYGSKSNSDF